MPTRAPSALTGLSAMIAACTVWGLSSLFYRELAAVPALEVLAHRTLWSLLFFLAVLAWRGEAGAALRALRRHAGAVAAAAILISMNWYGFIHSVQTGHALQASLGYYIFPLVAAALGMVLFGDRLGRLQAAALVLAGLAVATLTWGLGVAPWMSLMLALTFGLYGAVKKGSSLPPLVSTAAEVLLLGPLAAGLIGWLAWTGQGAFGRDAGTSLMLMLSGPLTGLPLLLFSLASQRIAMTTLGLVQYLNPTLQFAVAAAVFGEPMTPWHLAAFALIWMALALYSAGGIGRRTGAAALR